MIYTITRGKSSSKSSTEKDDPMMIASIRYLDELVDQDGRWLFAERRRMVDWTETRQSAA